MEVFASGVPDGQGEMLLGTMTATAGRAFTLTVGSPLKPHLTATATDAVKDTSEFSLVFGSRVHAVAIPFVMAEE